MVAPNDAPLLHDALERGGVLLSHGLGSYVVARHVAAAGFACRGRVDSMYS